MPASLRLRSLSNQLLVDGNRFSPDFALNKAIEAGTEINLAAQESGQFLGVKEVPETDVLKGTGFELGEDIDVAPRRVEVGPENRTKQAELPDAAFLAELPDFGPVDLDGESYLVHASTIHRVTAAGNGSLDEAHGGEIRLEPGFVAGGDWETSDFSVCTNEEVR
jgi:hypothetical protein